MREKHKRRDKLNVLLATGDPNLQDQILGVFRKKYAFVGVDSCKQAFEALTDSTFDAVILHPNIKEMQGFEAVELIKK
ncbi:MAG: hypothetical protein GWN00_23805 [Aliifodinibius sp.]|nr:hypothetical protein [Fodinibius sp.]NIY27718.1 hypothetical protein [Fodinibius sp.]